MEQRLNEKLAIIQTELKAKKSRYNSFGKYNFRSAEDILEAIKPFLTKHGVTVTIKEKLVMDGVIQSSAIITDGLEKIKSTAIVGVDMDQKGMQMPQRYGSASSYAKKYALGNLFLIDDTMDSDATNTHGKTEKPKKPSKEKTELKLDTFQWNRVVDGIKNGYTVEHVKQKYIITEEMEKMLNEVKPQKS